MLPGKAPGTRQAQEEHLRWWEQHYGGYALARIQPPLLTEAREALAEVSPRTGRPRAPATVNRYLAALGHLLTVAVREWHWLGSNPMVGVSKLREAKARTRFLSEREGAGGAGELDRLLAACRGSASPDLYPAVVMALCTGARRAEVLGLVWSDVDLGQRTVTFHKTKNRTVRTIQLPEEAVALLRARERRRDTARIFPGPKAPAKPVDLRSAWRTALKRAGVADFRWHDLRHTAASYLAMSGLPLHEIAAVLGHKSLSMTQRYAHLAPDHVARASRVLGARVMGGRRAGEPAQPEAGKPP